MSLLYHIKPILMIPIGIIISSYCPVRLCSHWYGKQVMSNLTNDHISKGFDYFAIKSINSIYH